MVFVTYVKPKWLLSIQHWFSLILHYSFFIEQMLAPLKINNFCLPLMIVEWGDKRNQDWIHALVCVLLQNKALKILIYGT